MSVQVGKIEPGHEILLQEQGVFVGGIQGKQFSKQGLEIAADPGQARGEAGTVQGDTHVKMESWLGAGIESAARLVCLT